LSLASCAKIRLRFTARPHRNKIDTLSVDEARK
jgi:hypothetical protein